MIAYTCIEYIPAKRDIRPIVSQGEGQCFREAFDSLGGLSSGLPWIHSSAGLWSPRDIMVACVSWQQHILLVTYFGCSDVIHKANFSSTRISDHCLQQMLQYDWLEWPKHGICNYCCQSVLYATVCVVHACTAMFLHTCGCTCWVVCSPFTSDCGLALVVPCLPAPCHRNTHAGCAFAGLTSLYLLAHEVTANW